MNVNDMMVSRRGGLIEAEVDGELVGLHIDNGNCYGFNQTATRIWKLIEQPKSLADICAALTAEFNVDDAECEAQVRALLAELEADGMVELKSGAAA